MAVATAIEGERTESSGFEFECDALDMTEGRWSGGGRVVDFEFEMFEYLGFAAGFGLRSG